MTALELHAVCGSPKKLEGPFMWIEKLESGVLRVRTPLGPRCVQLSFWQRVYLLWMFRHFHTLPYLVLNRRQQRLIDDLCGEQRFVSVPYGDGKGEPAVLGTIERQPLVEGFAGGGAVAKNDAVRVSPLADVRQRP